MLLLPLLVLAQVTEPPTPAAQLVSRTSVTEWVDELLDDGRYVRFGTKEDGPVHVWKPRGYKAQSASVVVYLHGFYTDVDGAMREHRLVTQFRDSGKNALFVVPQTRSWRTDPLYWPKLDELLEAVQKRLRLELPKRVMVVAHSGGYRNVAEWLGDERVTQVLLVDGLYGNEADFAKWLETDGHQLVLLGVETQQRIDWFTRKHGAQVELDTFPWMFDALPPRAKSAKVVSLHADRFDHMDLVEDGRVLPWLLHAF